MAADLGAFLRILHELRTIDSAFPIQYAICLAEISRSEGLSLTQLAERTGMPLPTVSRIVGALSSNRQCGAPYGLVVARLSPGQRRLKELRLTTRGRTVIGSIAAILGEAGRSPMSA